jgi:PAS domain S-box-containing protein
VLGQALPEIEHGGQVLSYVGTITDITDRKQIEDALRQSEEQRRLTLDLTHIGSWDWNVIANTMTWNDNHFYLLELVPGEVESSYQTWRDRVHPEDIEQTEQALAHAVATQTDFEAEYRIIYPDGTVRWLISKGRGIYDEDGKPTRMLGVVFDITDRKQAEEALRESEEQYRMTFDLAAVGVCHVDLDGRWLRFNQKICEIAGYSREELMGMTYQEITHPDDLEADLNYVRQLVAGEIPNFSMEKRYIRKDGSTVWINLAVSLARETVPGDGGDRLGRPKYMIGVVEDINDRKQAEFQLQQQASELSQLNAALTQTTAQLAKRNQELDRFVYVVSHDLKAPLRAIANLSQWIEEDLSGQLPEENQRQMQLLRQRVYRMEALIDGLLDYSRVGRTEATTETVNVGELLDEVIDSLAPPVTFTIQVQPQMPTIVAKRLLLTQVFANLISNAIKHHHRPDGRIEIAATEKGDYYEFAVTDDGPGIAPEYHERIFGIFQTLKANHSHESTGIGLSIVKKIIETEGGEIVLESELEKGATFRFTWLKQPKLPQMRQPE